MMKFNYALLLLTLLFAMCSCGNPVINNPIQQANQVDRPDAQQNTLKSTEDDVTVSQPEEVAISEPVIRFLLAYSSMTPVQMEMLFSIYPNVLNDATMNDTFNAAHDCFFTFWEEQGLTLSQAYLDEIESLVIWDTGDYSAVELAWRGDENGMCSLLLPRELAISSIDDFVHLNNLKVLSIDAQTVVDDISCLKFFQSIETFAINSDALHEISVLRDVSLKNLSLTSTNCISLSPLECQYELEGLIIQKIPISAQLNAIGHIDTLSFLALINNGYEDELAPLIETLPALKRLTICENSITDVEMITDILVARDADWLLLDHGYVFIN